MTKKIRDNIKEFKNISTLVGQERWRQCNKGFNAEHDDSHTDGSILQVALNLLTALSSDSDGCLPDPAEWVVERTEHILRKYRHAPIKQLVIAAAMIGAEVERLQRIELKPKRRWKAAKGTQKGE